MTNASKKTNKAPQVSDEEFNTIVRIAKRLAPRYIFGSYEKADIEQEAIIIGLDGMLRYDKSRPLENFLFTHINNRLKNFKRDNYFRVTTGNAEKVQQAKKNLLEASVTIDPIVHIEDDMGQSIDMKHAIEKLNRELPAKYRQDYLRLCANVRITKKRKTELIEVIKKILGAENDESN